MADKLVWTAGRGGTVRSCAQALLWSGALALSCASAQTVLKSSYGLVGTDLAVLEARQPREDLPCLVSPIKPVLGFDLRFHSGYEISVPLRELAGYENLLTVLFRVTPLDQPDQATTFTQRIRVPSLPEDAKGDAYLQGGFDLGEGKYKVDWLMRDRAERVCAGFWEVEALLPPKDKTVNVALPSGQAQATEVEQFAEEPPVERAQSEPLNVKVLINFAPQNAQAATLQPLDTAALISILRCIARDPRIAKFSIVAFNLMEQRILHRQDMADRIDFPAIGESLKNLQLGKVDVAKLAQKNADTEFLADLIRKEIGGDVRPDAIIFAGPKAMLAENVPIEVLRTVGAPDFPVFYMNYNLQPAANPWRDSISAAVKQLHGQEYTISRPRDLWFAVTEMMSKIVKSKLGKSAPSSAFR